MNSEKKYFLFPKPHFNHLFFLFYFISSILKQYILKSMKEGDVYNLSIPIFKLYIYEIGDFLSIIPYLILKKKTKSLNIAKSNDDDNKGNDYYIYNDIKIEQYNKNKKPTIINLFIISLVNFLALISTIIFYLAEGKQEMAVEQGYLNILLVFNIIFLFLLTKFMLNIELFFHHYFSLIIFIICLIVTTAIDFIAINESAYSGDKDASKSKSELINSVLYLVIRIFAVLLYSIENILAKIMFLKYYYSPYLLLLMKATIKLLFLIIFSIPLCIVRFDYGEKKGILIFSMISYIFDKKIHILTYIIYLINHFFIIF